MTDWEKKQVSLTYKVIVAVAIGSLTVASSAVGSAIYLARGWQYMVDRQDHQEKRIDKMELRQDRVEAIAYRIK